MSDSLEPYINPELEARIVAMVVGEASPFETEALEQEINDQPEVKLFYDRMVQLHELLGTIKADDTASLKDDQWKLPKKQRAKLIEQLSQDVADSSDDDLIVQQPSKTRKRLPLIQLAAALVIMAVAVALVAPAFMSSGVKLSESSPSDYGFPITSPFVVESKDGFDPPNLTAPDTNSIDWLLAQANVPKQEGRKIVTPKQQTQFEVRRTESETNVLAGKDSKTAGEDVLNLNAENKPVSVESKDSTNSSAFGIAGVFFDPQFKDIADRFDAPQSDSKRDLDSDLSDESKNPVTSALRSGTRAIDANSIDRLLAQQGENTKRFGSSIRGPEAKTKSKDFGIAGKIVESQPAVDGERFRLSLRGGSERKDFSLLIDESQKKLNSESTITPHVGYNGMPDEWKTDGRDADKAATTGKNSNDVFFGGVSLGIDFGGSQKSEGKDTAAGEQSNSNQGQADVSSGALKPDLAAESDEFEQTNYGGAVDVRGTVGGQLRAGGQYQSEEVEIEANKQQPKSDLKVVDIEGSDPATEEYIRSQLRLKKGEVIDSSKVYHDLAWLNKSPHKKVDLFYAPGSRYGDESAIVGKDKSNSSIVEKQVDVKGDVSIGYDSDYVWRGKRSNPVGISEANGGIIENKSNFGSDSYGTDIDLYDSLQKHEQGLVDRESGQAGDVVTPGYFGLSDQISESEEQLEINGKTADEFRWDMPSIQSLPAVGRLFGDVVEKQEEDFSRPVPESTNAQSYSADPFGGDDPFGSADPFGGELESKKSSEAGLLKRLFGRAGEKQSGERAAGGKVVELDDLALFDSDKDVSKEIRKEPKVEGLEELSDIEESLTNENQRLQQIADDLVQLRFNQQKAAGDIVKAETPSVERKSQDAKRELSEREKRQEALVASILKLEEENGELKDKISTEEGKQWQRRNKILLGGTEATVIGKNDEWGFLIVNAGKDLGVKPNSKLLVKRDGRQVATMRVTALRDKVSVCEVVEGSLLDKETRVQAGDKIIFQDSFSNDELPPKKEAPKIPLSETSASENPFSTFSLHVSDVSFKLAHAALMKGEWPEAERIRLEEFVNAMDYFDQTPSAAAKVSATVEQAIHPTLTQRNVMRIALKTAEMGRNSQTPLNLVFLLDSSGSMERFDRQETLSRAFALLANQLNPQDKVTLISFARTPRLIADGMSGDQCKELVRIVAGLPEEGGTNLEAALKLAHQKALEYHKENVQSRVILLTDGAANLGSADPEQLSKLVIEMRNKGLAFDAAGLGAEDLNDEILEALTRKGDGRYYVLNKPEDADANFARQIAGALRPAAMNVKVQVVFNPLRVGKYQLHGYEKHRLNKEDFKNDQVDAAELSAAEAGVAVYHFEPLPEGVGDIGEVKVRFRDMSTGKMFERSWPIPYNASSVRFDDAPDSIKLATTAATVAAKLKGKPLGSRSEWHELAATMDTLDPKFRANPSVVMLTEIIQKALTIK